MTAWSRNTRWRQGHLLDVQTIEALGLGREDLDGTLVIVATHHCDLASLPDCEPLVEVIIGRRVDKDGNHTHAKNSRKLHIEFSGDTSFWGEFEAGAKRGIDKELLAPYTPRGDAQLNQDNQAIFQIWLASRYRRSAFPDEFDRRLKANKLDEKISKAVKPHGEMITGVFFDVDGGADNARSGADDIYTLEIVILHASEPDFVHAEKVAQQIASTIMEAFKRKLFQPTGQWQEIELGRCEYLSESVLSFQEFKRLKRYRLEHLSLNADPQQPVPGD